MLPQVVVTSKDSLLPVSLAEAKQHLRLDGDHMDDVVLDKLQAAVDYCERRVARSLRLSHTLTQTYQGWPTLVRFERQPVKSITSITYYDANNAQQTLAASNYLLIASTEASATFCWDANFSVPTVYDRGDAVTITYVAGYATITDVPHAAREAIKLKLGMLMSDMDDRSMEQHRRAIEDLLGSVETGMLR